MDILHRKWMSYTQVEFLVQAEFAVYLEVRTDYGPVLYFNCVIKLGKNILKDYQKLQFISTDLSKTHIFFIID